METTLYLIMVTVFVTYITITGIAFGILPSISASYYALKNPLQKLGFTLFIWGFALPLIPLSTTLFGFLAGGFIAFVGAACAYKQELTEKVHIVGAVGGILFGLLYIIVDLGQWQVAFITVLPIAALALLKPNNKTYWIEIVAFVGIMLGILNGNIL